jgi:hypothetical protein
VLVGLYVQCVRPVQSAAAVASDSSLAGQRQVSREDNIKRLLNQTQSVCKSKDEVGYEYGGGSATEPE